MTININMNMNLLEAELSTIPVYILISSRISHWCLWISKKRARL